MRKKWVTAGVGLGIGVVMLLASGFSAMANTSGYDAYKSALKNTKAETSLTTNVDLIITENGKKLVAGTADLKLNKKQKAGSVAATFGDSSEKQSLNVFRQDGKVVFKSSENDVYKVKELNAPKWQQKEGDKSHPPKAVEQVFETLLGNIRELATVESEADGGKHAELHLSEDQIPAVVNALGTLAVTKFADHDKMAHGENTSDWKVNVPKLTDNIKVEKIDLDAKINADNLLEEQMAEINITGTDDTGKKHVLTIKLHVDYYGFNKTIPEHIDLTGKKIEEIKNDGMKRGWHH